MTKKNLFLISIALVVIIVVFEGGPISQDQGYHDFADQRTVLGLLNGYNVLSNMLFVIAGAWGSVFLLYLLNKGGMNALLMEYFFFFAGVLLSGIGSMYYHYHPSDASLIWDRLPMSIAFMALFSSVISERVDRKAGAVLLGPLLALGALSVGYWAWSGDLRIYVVVQFLPMIMIPLILLLYKPPRTYGVHVWSLVILYFVSKVFEYFDLAVYSAVGITSGHTLKHVLAALGTACIIKMLYERMLNDKLSAEKGR